MSKKSDFMKNVKGMNQEELAAKIKEDELRIQKLRFAHSLSPVDNPQSIKTLRRDIARLKTQLRNLQIGA